MLETVLHPITQSAMQQFGSTLISYLQAAKFERPLIGRIPMTSSAPGAPGHETIQRQSYCFRLVSITESYTDLLFSDLLFRSIYPDDPVQRKMAETIKDKTAMSWSERKESYAAYFQISWGGWHSWSRFNLLIEARNAVAHGLGRLTSRQMQKNSLSQVKQVGLEIVDGGLVFTNESVEICYDVCKGFVLDLDKAATVLPLFPQTYRM